VSDSVHTYDPEKAVKHWSIEDVSGWLDALNLSSCISSFCEAEIDGEVLLQLKFSMLKVMNLPLGKMIKVMKAIETLKSKGLDGELGM